MPASIDIQLKQRICRLTAVAGVALTVLGGLVAAAPASSAAPVTMAAPAAGPTIYGLTSGNVTVHSGRHAWRLFVTLSGALSFQAVNIGISAPVRGGTEQHLWDMAAPRHSFSFSTRTRKATLNMKLLPVGTIKLTFKGRSKRKTSCGTTYSGSLTGSVTLHTGFKSEPTLGGKHLTFRRVNTLVANREDCVTPQPCQRSSWGAGSIQPNSPPFAEGSSSGSVSHPSYAVNVQQEIQLSRPKNTFRFDSAVMRIGKPSFKSATKTLKAAGKADKLVTGSVQISKSTNSESETSSCKVAGKSYSDHGTIFFSASESSSHLAAHTILTGVLAVPASGPGFIDNFTLKRK